MVKYLKTDYLSSRGNFFQVSIQSEATTEDILDYTKLVGSKNETVIYTGSNNLTNGMTTMSKIKKLVQCVGEIERKKDIQIGFSSIIHTAGTRSTLRSWTSSGN